MSRSRVHAAFAFLTAALACCTSWGTPRSRDDAGLERRPSRIRVTLTGGDRLVIERPAIVGDTLVGDRIMPLVGGRLGATTRVRVSFPLAQVDSISLRELDAPLTMVVAMGGLVALAAAAGAADPGPGISCGGSYLR